jgi:iron complex transport system ATP-binding protein
MSELALARAPALAARGLVFRHPRGGGVDGVDLELLPGEVLGILGPNGAGKSTLVRLLSGVLRPAAGEILLGGTPLAALATRERARRVAVVPQELPFDAPFTVLELVLLGRHPHLSGLAFESQSDVALAREALSSMGLAALADRPLTELSAGERQRALFARALAQDAPVLLLDEPASALDLRYQVELFENVLALARAGRAVAAVLHDLNLAAEYCDRVLLLRAGRVHAAGPTAATLTYENLRRVYDTEIYVDLNDLTGSLVVTPLSGRARRRLGELP